MLAWACDGEVTAGVDPRGVPHESQAKICARPAKSCSQVNDLQRWTFAPSIEDAAKFAVCNVSRPGRFCFRRPKVRLPLPLDRQNAIAVSTAEPKRRDSSPQVSLLQGIEQRRQNARTAGADRMTERHGAAVDVHLARVNGSFSTATA